VTRLVSDSFWKITLAFADGHGPVAACRAVFDERAWFQNEFGALVATVKDLLLLQGGTRSDFP
jgi:hypothetical protein